MEEELGVRLLDRNRSRQVNLTDAGHSFLIDARRMVAFGVDAKARAQEAARGSRGKLTIANIASLSPSLLPSLLQVYRSKYPQVEISLIEMTRQLQLENLRSGRIQLGIFPDLGAPFDRRYEAWTFFSCPMVVVLPASHGLIENGKRGIAIAALAGKTFLTPSPKDAPGYLERFRQLCALADFVPSRVKVVEGLQNNLAMVAAGYGVSVFPEVVVPSVGPACRTLRLRPPVPKLVLKLVWLRGSSSLVLKNFLALAKKRTVEKQI